MFVVFIFLMALAFVAVSHFSFLSVFLCSATMTAAIPIRGYYRTTFYTDVLVWYTGSFHVLYARPTNSVVIPIPIISAMAIFSLYAWHSYSFSASWVNCPYWHSSLYVIVPTSCLGLGHMLICPPVHKLHYLTLLSCVFHLVYQIGDSLILLVIDLVFLLLL